MPQNITVIIPALNEAHSICKVLEDIPQDLVKEVIVVDNGSKDDTTINAKKCGATVLTEDQKGYGNACLRGIEYLSNHEPPDIVVFLDGDYSDHPEEMGHVVKPILNSDADLVIGSREKGNREAGSMTFPQIFGNRLATFLIKLFYRERFTDLGPFRAIRYESLLKINMEDKNYGWTVEMQLKAAKHGLKCVEVPVSYRKRIGKSKVSGTVKGTFMAGYKILWTIFKYL
jgi:glycosyltransferase involved in cell wall biosynthesis